MADSDREDSPDSDYKEDSSPLELEDNKPTNSFRNDGSFMEMFKKMQEQPPPSISKTKVKHHAEKDSDELEFSKSSESSHPKKPTALSFVGKRRGGRTLPTGMVKKVKRDEPTATSSSTTTSTSSHKKTDAWSQYMNEVKKYREQSCEEEGKRRPLVK